MTRRRPEPEVTALCAARRVLVLGPSGAGKTHLALRLGPLLGLPLIHLDALRRPPGRDALPDAEWRPTAAALARRPAWVMDGTYESTLDLRIPAADVVVLLERGRLACLATAVQRVVVPRRPPGPSAPPPQPLNLAFLRYLWRYNAVFRPFVLERLREHGAGTSVLSVHSRREADHLVRTLARFVRTARDGGPEPARAPASRAPTRAPR